MTNLLDKLRIKNLKENLKEIWTRFPLSVVAIIVTFLLFAYNISVPYIDKIDKNFLIKFIISTIVVFFLSVGTSIMAETLEFKRFKKNLLYLITIFFWLAFCCYFWRYDIINIFYSEKIVYIIIVLVWIIAFLFSSPFLLKMDDEKFPTELYYNYFIKISFIFLISFILWGLFSLLWSIWIWSIFTLFDLNLAKQWDFYAYLFNFALVVFAPLYFLSQLPKNILKKKKVEIHSFFRFIINFVVIPFVIGYFFILYSYSVKVLLNFDEWPHWEVSWMVIWFSILWYVSYVFSQRFEEKNNFITKFRKVLPIVIFFQLPMLFYAIYLRINQYDVTINRYFVVVFWLWLTVISLYLILSKKKILTLIPISLFTAIAIISIWPWWVYSLPESRQIWILNENLRIANILNNWKITIPEKKTDLDPIISGKIYDLIWYLVNNHGTKSITKVFPKLVSDIRNQDRINWDDQKINDLLWIKNVKYRKTINEKQYYWISSWELINELRKKLKVEAYYWKKIVEKQYIAFSVNYSNQKDIIDITGYNYLLSIWENTRIYNDIITNKDSLYYSEFDINNSIFKILKEWKVIEEFDFTKDFLNMYNKYEGNISKYWQVEIRKPFIAEKQWENIDIKMVLTNFSIKNPKYSWWNDFYFNISWDLLIREK